MTLVNLPSKIEAWNRLCSLRAGKNFPLVCAFCAFLWRILPVIGSDSLCEGVAVDAEHGGRVGDVLLVTGERLLNIELLKLAHRLVKQNMAFEHFVDQIFKTVVDQSSFPVSSR